MIYLLLSILGIVLPLSPTVQFLIAHQFNVGLFVQEATASAVSLTAWLDVIITALAVLTFVFLEGKRLGIKRLSSFALATVLVGPSLGLPLFLLVRSRRLSATEITPYTALLQE